MDILTMGRELVSPLCPKCGGTLLEIAKRTFCEWCDKFVPAKGKRRYYQER